MKNLMRIMACMVALLPYVEVKAQVGMGGIGPEMLVIAMLGQRNDCKTKYPKLAPALDKSLESMIKKNLESYTRETWIELSLLTPPNIPELSQKQCTQLSKGLASFNWKPLIADFHELACQNAMQRRDFESRSVIRVRIDESVEGARIEEVSVGGPASMAGLRGGDLITEFGGLATPTLCKLAFAIARSKAGIETTAKVVRYGAQMQIRITPVTASVDN